MLMASVKLFYNLMTTAAKPSLAIPLLKVLCSKVSVALKMSTTCLTVLYIPILVSGFLSQPSCGQYSITFPKLSLAIPSLKVICSKVAGALKMSTTCLTLLYIPILVSGFLSQPSCGQYSITFPKLVQQPQSKLSVQTRWLCDFKKWLSSSTPKKSKYPVVRKIVY